ncbi:coiled-coil domain-containing protein 74B isoform X2 [Podarcis raffonei]|uniref:coiled-coil domain-containing protein 74B isoform X2 n=1 Tax=Podarcis raffonei TaxID=65483 RepID=UPI0023296B3B|nr:coiled-coil domain-containing protein 74B isoform X2 [Podarcis raffonei]
MQSSGFPSLGLAQQLHQQHNLHLPPWSRFGGQQPPPSQQERAASPAQPSPSHPASQPHPPRPPRTPSADGWRRAATDLERSLKFMQAQYAETLQKLHEEIDVLKRQNKDLNYKLIMNPILQRKDHSSSNLPSKSQPGSSAPGKTSAGLKMVAPAAKEEHREQGSEELEKKPVSGEFMMDETSAEEEIIEKEVDRVMWKELEDFRPEQETVPEEAPHPREADVCDRMTSPIPFSSGQSRAGDVKIPAASSNPFLVTVLPSYMRKPPTLEECEVVIRQLWNINHMQMQELMYLRSCLEDIHKTKRIPEDYMLAGHVGNQEVTRLPKVKNGPKKWILTPLPAAERAVLPALKQTLGNAFAERQKRTQAVQRNRLHRTAL